MAELNVRLRAEIDDLEKKLKLAQKDLIKTGEVAEDLEKDLNKIGSKGAKGVQKLGKSTKNVTPTLLEFNRTIQDAPFGIQGVANNIQQLTANFGHLSQSAGGPIKALKAMAAGLLGPQGVLLAVSAVTALFVAFGDRLTKTKDEAAELTAELKKQAEALEKYRESLTGVNRATLEGSINAAKELTNLRLLQAQVEDATLSTEKRTEAVEELRRLYPSYLKDISNENALNKALIPVYTSLTAVILEKAKAQAASSLILENTRKELILQSQLEEQSLKNAEKKAEIEEEGLKAKNNLINRSTKLFDKEAILNAELNDGLKETERIQGEITKLQENSLTLAAQIKQQGGIVPLDFAGGGVEAFKNEFRNLAEVFEITAAAQKKLEKGFLDLPKTIAASTKLIVPGISTMEAALIQFNEMVTEIVDIGLTNALSGIGQAIGGALIEGGNVFSAVGKSLLSSFGAILTQLGEMMIQMGLSLILAKAALKSLNPALAIAGGVALVAIGAAFSASTSSAGGSIGSGAVAGQGSTSDSLTTGSGAFGTTGGLNQTVVFEIAGTKLLGVLRNTEERNTRLGSPVIG